MHTGQTDETGTQASRPRVGNNAGQIDAEQSPQNMRVVEWLARHHPSQVNRVLVSQALSLNVALRVTYDTRTVYDDKGNPETIFFASGGTATGQIEDLEDVKAKIEAAMQPADDRRIEGWLAELSVITIRRAGDAFSEELRLDAYAKRLREYPADVTRAALLDHSWKFWPSWSELADVCDTLVMERRVLRGAVYSAQRRVEQPTPSEPTKVDHEAIKESATRILEEAGFNSRRANLVKSAPLARSLEEAEKRVEQTRVPHWSETAAPDDYRWEILRKSRIASGMIKE